jgi:hypothetical protein
MMHVLPPGEMSDLTCKDCGGNQFNLVTESRDDEIETFHTKCTGCGKRGVLEARTKLVTTRKFVQFADPPKPSGVKGAAQPYFTTTVTELMPSTTTSTAPDLTSGPKKPSSE